MRVMANHKGMYVSNMKINPANALRDIVRGRTVERPDMLLTIEKQCNPLIR